MTGHDVERTVSSNGNRLGASLRLPSRAAPGTLPAVLLLAGSGPLDRDGNAPGMPIGIQRALAVALATAGYASLRFDRRGVADGGDWREASFEDNYRDAEAAWHELIVSPAVDPDRMVVIGHSEGALHATRLAAAVAPAATVLLAGAARPGSEVLLWQAETIAGATEGADVAQVVAQSAAAQQALRATTTAVATVGGQEMNAAWFREFLDYDARTDLKNITTPLLAITGDKDLQVPPSDLEAIAALVPGRCETHRPADVTHLLRTDPAPPSMADYARQVSEPMDPAVIRMTILWLDSIMQG